MTPNVHGIKFYGEDYVNNSGVKTKTCNKPCLTVCMLNFYPKCDKQYNKKCKYNGPKVCNYSEESNNLL